MLASPFSAGDSSTSLLPLPFRSGAFVDLGLGFGGAGLAANLAHLCGLSFTLALSLSVPFSLSLGQDGDGTKIVGPQVARGGLWSTIITTI